MKTDIVGTPKGIGKEALHIADVRLPLLTVPECEDILREIQSKCYIKNNGEATISIEGIRMIANKIKELGK